jgi:hypothetical protein
MIVLPREASGEDTVETMQRVRGELAADGFDVVLVDRVDADRVATLVRVGRESGTTVCGGVFVDGARGVDLVLVDPVTGRNLTRHLESEAGVSPPAPQVIARRTVDLLRVSLLDFLVDSLRSAEGSGRSPPAPPADAHPREERPPMERRRWAIEAGAGVLGGFGGVGPAVSPITRVRFAFGSGWQMRATITWLGSRPRLEAAGGSASVEQGAAMIEGAAEIAHWRWFRPAVSAGAGAYYVGVDGTGTATSRGQHASGVAFALDAGLGGAVPLSSRFEAIVEVHAILAMPGLAVRFLDTDAAKIGRPSILATLTIAGWI